MPPRPRSSGNDPRRALRLLAGSPDGCTEALLLAHGFSIELLASLVDAGLATATTEGVARRGRLIEVTRMEITGAGRKALA